MGFLKQKKISGKKKKKKRRHRKSIMISNRKDHLKIFLERQSLIIMPLNYRNINFISFLNRKLCFVEIIASTLYLIFDRF